MSELLPTVQATEIRDALLDYLKTTFALADADAQRALVDFLTDPANGIFSGPYLRIRMPFQPATGEWRQHLDWDPGFTPYGHQARAFERLSTAQLTADQRPQPTLITTGTGSGKTEAFMFPILDHVRRARRQGITGMKALILYPMNALANDQAGRLTRWLTTYPELAGITAAIYTGDEAVSERTLVSEAGLITSRAVIRDTAPDIVLTNYKMLDQLLLRDADARLWEQSALSLRYLVLDEFHTYDGAQGTDVAMLLRRLGLALKHYWPDDGQNTSPLTVGAVPISAADRARPLGRITPVATSATLGDRNDPAAMIDFAATVFGDEFSADSVITESRLTVDQWRAAARPVEGLQPVEPTPADLNQAVKALGDAPDPADLAATVTAVMYGCDPATVTRRVGDDPAELLRTLAAHELIGRLADATAQASDLAALPEIVFPGTASRPDDTAAQEAVVRIVAALSHLRARLGPSAPSIDLHLWIRELTRIDRIASAAPTYRWSDDGTVLAGHPVGAGSDLAEDEGSTAFPAIYCRHCGRSGWGVALAPVGNNLGADDTAAAIRRTHVTHEGRFRALLHAIDEASLLDREPDDRGADVTGVADGNGVGGREIENLRWFSLPQRALLPRRPDADDPDYRGGRVLPVLTQVGDDADLASHADTCPSCQQRDGIRFLGSAVATLLSVTLSSLFGDAALDQREKKSLVFTDSVQDAAHRAGFVESRSHTLTLRAVLRDAVGDHPITLDELAGEALTRAGDDPFRRYRLLPPDLAERDTFTAFWQRPTLRAVPPRVRGWVRSRLAFDASLEVGLQSRFGRTLEQTGSLGVEVACPPAKIIAIARAVLGDSDGQDTLSENLAHAGDQSLLAWVRGVLEHIRERGGIEHPWLDKYIREDGNRYRIWGGRPKSEGMPAFPTGRSAPAFPRVGPTTRRDPLLDPVTAPQSWYARWTGRTLGVGDAFGGRLAKQLLAALAREDVLHKASTEAGATVYQLSPSQIVLTPLDLGPGHHDPAGTPDLLICDVCHHHVPGSRTVIDQLAGAPCMLVRCPGTMHRRAWQDNYYRRLYASADPHRLVAREHSSLLEPATRVRYENLFRAGQEHPDAPNVLVATPTLEMGIDIGDLSTVMLASLPRTVASYLQRVGRAGRLTGNALTLAYVNGRGDALPRLGEPLSMINGEVRPPATYLSAEEILQRQYLAHLVDAFARDHTAPHPRRASAALGDAGADSFLGRLVRAAEQDAPAHLDTFCATFGDALSPTAEQALRTWATPADGPDTSPLARTVYAAAQRWSATVEGLEHRRTRIQSLLPELRQAAERTVATDEDRRAYRSARAADRLAGNELHRLHGQYWIQVLEEFGLLPNYTLIDDSVTLDVALSWIDPDTQEFKTEPVSYTRASANALREFAPGATFYARGLRVAIDAVDLGPDDDAITTMAFCPDCGYAVDLSPGEGVAAPQSCPRCGSLGVGGTESHLEVVELTRVSAEMRRDEAGIDDRDDERERAWFSLVLAADIDPAQVARTWYVEHEPFGVKYLSRLDLRWLNTGKRQTSAPARQLAGEQVPAGMFRVCEGCGHLDTATNVNSRREHRAWCRYRDAHTEHVRTLALMRTLRTQGAVLRLPPAITVGDRFALVSLAAAIKLGLREQIGGAPDHIDVTTIHEPLPGGGTSEALLLHDLVPGGTGYLAELAEPERVYDLLHRAWRVLRNCPCIGESRLACHRCLLPFVPPSQASLVSRETAERHLRTLLCFGVDREADPPAQMPWTVVATEQAAPNPESYLEQRFRAVLTDRVRRLGATVTETPGPHGNRMVVTFPHGARQWRLDPQELMGGTRPDFVLSCNDPNVPRIAIFTDGWQFHASPGTNRLADDADKRRTLREGNVIVLGITAADVDQAEAGASVRPDWLSQGALGLLMSRGPRFGQTNVDLVAGGPIDLILGWLQHPDPDGQAALSDDLPYVFLVVGTGQRTLSGGSLERQAADLLKQAEDTTAATGAGDESSVGWWWRNGYVGVLTRLIGPPEAPLVEVAVILDDRADAVADPHHRACWQEWLRISNALAGRIQPTWIGVVSDVKHHVEVVAPQTLGVAVEFAPRWSSLQDMATEEEWEFLQGLAARDQVPLPELGFEQDGIPIDCAWPDDRVAVFVTEPDQNDLRTLQRHGWRVLPADLATVTDALSNDGTGERRR